MEDNDPVPAYTPLPSTPAADLTAFLTTALPPSQRALAQLTLPITHWPPTPTSTPLNPYTSPTDHSDIPHLQRTLITTLHTAITTSNTDVPPLLITSGLLSPDVPDATGATPLIAAVAAGSGPSLCALLNLGADPNRFGVHAGRKRTPLMVAAALGRLALVKVLVEDFGADDALVAPDDGYIALRLAAEAGHREVVAYLPARRAGAGRRVRRHFEVVVVRRIQKLGWEVWRFVRFFVWEVPRFLVWDCVGRGVVVPVWRGGKWCWGNRGRFGGWCKGEVKKFPGRVKRVGKAAWKGVKRAPGVVWKGVKKVPGVVRDVARRVWDVVKEIPGVLKRLVMACWRVLKRVPGTVLAVLEVVGRWLKRAGGAVADVLLRVVSVLHTAVTALVGWFRTITLKDVWNGVCAVLDAVFVGLPKALWSGFKTAGEVVVMVFLGLFGFTGQLIIWLFQGLWWLAKYIPERLWKILCGIGSAFAKGFHEVMVLFNPKY
ncbi:ankyrin repeat domain-containing protein 50 [Podospora conica]|nr:ankyrin repeat domain-containing protein 50 [Schizothecium conicum]